MLFLCIRTFGSCRARCPAMYSLRAPCHTSAQGRDGAMSSMYDRLRHRPVVAVAAVAGLVLAAAACSSNSATRQLGRVRRKGHDQHRLRAAGGAAARCSTRSGWRTWPSSRRPIPASRSTASTTTRASGTRDVHRDAARRDRAGPLLHLLHRPAAGAARGPGRRHHHVRELHDRAEPQRHRAELDEGGDGGQRRSTACRPPTTPRA